MADESPTVAQAAAASAASGGSDVEIRLSPGNIWRVGFVIVGVFAVASFLWFIIDDGGSVIFTVLMSWFAAIAMEPAVSRLARHMKRGFATALMMLGIGLFIVIFFAMFGALLVEQLAEIIGSIPDLLDSLLAWVNDTFDQQLTRDGLLEQINLSPSQIAEIATEIGVNALSILGSVLGSVFGLFTFGLFTFYLSADSPRLRRWVAALFPGRVQGIVINVWDLTAEKTGGYVAARVILAALNGGSSAIVFLIIGMPYWLALGLWTGLVAQFVPTIGTYISIILPVLVGLLSDNPVVGIIALIWALIYQQVENLTFEPRISAAAVDVHPAVAFGAVMMGAALFGVSGALLAVPVGAMLLSLLDIYVKRHELLPQLREKEPSAGDDPPPAREPRKRPWRRKKADDAAGRAPERISDDDA
ncbi:MAG: AI-2E family transporter [Actinobacteria bacterium]|nr:AI-2E family transporter [Actinomycetota bacterium]